MNYNESDYDVLSPDPESFLQSARSFGYALETAIADVIDNSITAKATKIQITYGIDKYSSFVRIEDNGVGMDEKELLTAMKIGSFNPNSTRNINDLGRFGLGLKTASFSQCRRLTVSSNLGITKCWDLDLVAEKEDWILLRNCIDKKSKNNLASLNLGLTGTIVLWEKLDRLVETDEPVLDREHFYRKFENVKKHLGLIFHRYIEEDGLLINVLNETVLPINPFHISLDCPSNELQEEQLSINNQKVSIQPFILPHESKLSKEERDNAQMTRGITEHQGIFLYRNRRLISEGTWLDLNFRIKENQRLCRIAIDIPNTLDKEWQIDVKKASAKIPDILRKRIKEICLASLEKAIKVYTHRGAYVRRKGEQKELIYIWKAKQKQGKKFYEINANHPVVDVIVKSLGDQSFIFNDFIKLIGETIPITAIVNDFSDPKTVMKDFFEDQDFVLYEIYQNTLIGLIKSGVPEAEARNKIKNIDCFQRIINKL